MTLRTLLVALAITFSVSVLARSESDLAADVRSFTDGTASKYDTAGHPKAKGLEVTLQYPPSWQAKEGERPNVVQKFVSEHGGGLEVCTFLVKALPVVPSEADMADLFSEQSLPNLLPGGSRYIDGTLTKIDGQPAARIRAMRETQSAGMSLRSIEAHYFFQWRDRFGMFQCISGADMRRPLSEHAAHFDRMQAVFTQMALSIVIQSKWKD
ncbi:hypothetical protein [Alkalilimnicola sp. S0819]|uniref:hypothetical protein n=1 Tax=Alkalilimnicola sp. S0819 TaxID=2613922 RepID=UPI0012624A2B|nr:hypothetical protein [Alkalilimnicola sp. S0819]KAB7619456.1 hypothetical protein F3N43_13740 [Alkalilimnicola sp. S0819]MPQ17699.1 hypothetical protein [Alkalilimnicola sp. S0819]